MKKNTTVRSKLFHMDFNYCFTCNIDLLKSFQHFESDESQKLLKTSEEKRISLDTLKDATLEEMQRLLGEDQAFASLKLAVL